MAFVPIRIGEKLRIIETSRKDPLQREIDEQVAEQWRVHGVVQRRKYADGEQYADDNLNKFYELKLDPLSGCLLPEHEKKHAYSTQIGESVKFIADQLAESFEVVAIDDAVQAIIDDALRLSGQLSGTGEDDDVSIEEVLEDVLTAGDVAVELRWDPDQQAVFYDLWESEVVEVVWADRDNVEQVLLREFVWRFDEDLGEERQVEERTEWEMAVRRSATDEGVEWLECQRSVFWDNEEEPHEQEWTGFPFIPWALLRCQKKGLRAQRGSSMITDQVMSAADRYNANENLGYLIARFNSHASLAVTGDAATLKMDAVGYLDKDIDDVLGFPGGTDLKVLQLPTDPKMIEHQRAVLSESIYAAFGLTRIEPDTIQGLGQVSGYALEILNRKTEGTFRKIKRHFVRDLRSLFAMTIDLYEALAAEDPVNDADALDQLMDSDAQGSDVPAWVTQEELVYADRTMEIRMGSGYVVDDVLTREDFTANLTSRSYALKERGIGPEDIKQIELQITEEAKAKTAAVLGESSRFGSQRGTSTGTAPSDTVGA